MTVLSTIEVHDLPVVKMELLFEVRQFVLWLEEDVEGRYVPMSITFSNVVNLYTNNSQSSAFTCESICSITCEAVGHNQYKAVITIEMGHSNPVFVITVVFSEVEVQRGHQAGIQVRSCQ